jgi:hypothetical protein
MKMLTGCDFILSARVQKGLNAHARERGRGSDILERDRNRFQVPFHLGR